MDLDAARPASAQHQTTGGAPVAADGTTPDLARWLRIAAVVVGLAWLPIVLVWGPLPHALTFDDAWYYFGIARNVGGGEGSTFDGINTTNGYHPLWLLVSAVPYALGLEGLTAVRSLLVVQLGLYVAALWVLAGCTAAPDGHPSWGRLAGRRDVRTAARACTVAVVGVWGLAIATPGILRLFVNGMESGAVALVGALLLTSAVRHRGDLLAAPALTLLLFSLSFLARTDTAVLVGAALLWCSLVRGGIDRQLLAVGGAFTTVVLAYLAANVALTGHPMQISGVSKQVAPDAGRLLLVGLCIGAAVALLATGLRARRRGTEAPPPRLPRTAAWFGATAWWAAGGVLLVGYSRGLATEDYLWHYVPQGLWLLALLAHVVADLAEGVVLERPTGDPTAPRRAAMVGAVLVLPFAGGFLLQTRSFVDPELRALQLGDRAAAEWIAANLPAGAVVGSFDAGVVGYFAERPVVNLDGLVSSYEWRDARAAGTAATAAFLRSAGVSHLANHGGRDATGEDASLREAADRLWGDGTGAALELLHREDYVYAGRAGGTYGSRPYATYVYALRDHQP